MIRKYLRVVRGVLAVQGFAGAFGGIILLLACGTMTAGENLFEGGNFETADPKGHPAGWIPLDRFGWDVETDGNLFYVSRDARAGNGAAAILLDTVENGWSACPVKGLKADTWYGLSAWVKTGLNALSGNGPTIFIFQHPQGDHRMGTSPDKFLGTFALGKAPQDWELMKLAFKTPAEPDNLYVGMGLYHAKGIALFDDLRIEQINEAAARKITGICFIQARRSHFNGNQSEYYSQQLV